jgi:2-methylcitrate dehydratase
VHTEAIAERQVTPLQFEMRKIVDPRIREQLHKIVVVADPEIEKVFPALQRVIVKITTTDGRSFEKQLDYPKGDPRNPLTDREVEEKFEALSEPVLSAAAQQCIVDATWNLDTFDDIAEYMQLLQVEKK